MSYIVAAARCGIAEPFVGLMTAAETEHARVAAVAHDGVTVAAAVSIGLSNTTSAGVSAPVPAPPATINIVILVDATLVPAAMVNAVITATEAKTMVLREWDVRTADGRPASGTSTDAVVVAATGRGEPLAYAGPATVPGWLVGRSVRLAMTDALAGKVERDGGRFGW